MRTELNDFGRMMADLFGFGIGSYRIDLIRDEPILQTRQTHTTYKPNFDSPELKDIYKNRVYKWLEERGEKIIEAPKDEIEYTFGPEGDPVGCRDGNNIHVSTNYRGRDTTIPQRMVIAAHEHGHKYTPDEAKAHWIGINLLKGLGEYEAEAEAIKMAQRMGWDRN